MTNSNLLGSWVRRFLLEYLVKDRNLSVNTQSSYRDMLLLLLTYANADLGKPVDRLEVNDLSPKLVRQFLIHIEQNRRCSAVTRNQRLGGLHALARFIGENSPDHLEWCTQIRLIPFKKVIHPTITYLNRAEMNAILAAPNRRTPQGQRDYALLLFLYNTGGRASEVSNLRISDINRYSHSVQFIGKGNKVRCCPLWAKTVDQLYQVIGKRSQEQHVFLNRNGQPITRFGIHTMVERNALKAEEEAPSLNSKRVSPHVIRHTTATHLLHAGVDINTIRAWLGHVSINTTNIYAETNLETKERALASCAPETGGRETGSWRNQPSLIYS